jgi:dodecin
MSVAKVIEIKSTSTESFEHAVQQGIEVAGKTITDIKSAWVSEQEVKVSDGKIVEYRVLLKITFVVR